jgi:ubiquitin carboxyl-terminal hydrolase 9/24
MKGILNIGNSCYLNSAVQLLFNSKLFCSTLLSSTSNEPSILLLKNNINKYHDTTNQIFIPNEIKSLVAHYAPQFAGFSQEDSSEFIIYLFDIISKIAELDSNLCKQFKITTTVNIKCKLTNCLHENEHNEYDMVLHLPIMENLDEMYRKYKLSEIMENSYTCDKCNKNTITRKKLITADWPNHLIIVLKRFENDLSKNSSRVKIPLQWRHNYKLQGGIVHMGGMGCGHYVYFGLVDNEWYIANDNNIIKINDIVLNECLENSYILYYAISDTE